MADYQIVGDITADVSSAVRDMDRFLGKLKEVDNGVDSLIRHMDELDGKSASIDIKGIESLDHAIEKLDELDAKKATASVEIRGIEEARADIDILQLELDHLDRTYHVKIDCDDHCLNAIEGDAKKAESAIGGGGMGGGGLMGAIAALGPALIPIGGVAVGGLGAIAASAGVAGAGVLGFGAIAAPVFKDVIANSQNLDKVWKQINDAQTPQQLASALQKQKQILDGMDPSMAKAVKGLEDLKKQYKDLQTSIKPEIYSIFAKGLEFLSGILKDIAPMVKSVAKEIDGLMSSLNKNMKASDVAKDIKDLTTNAASFIGVWARSVGNFVVGVMNMLDAFLPLSKSFNGGMEDMSKRFRDWTAGLSKNKDFQNFVSYVRQNTPEVLHLIGGLITLIVNLAKALAPLGGAVLHGVTSLVDKINDFAKSNPDIMKMVASVAAVGTAIATLPGVSGLAQKALEPLMALLVENPVIGLVAGVAALAVVFGKTKDKAAFFKELKGLWNDMKKIGGDLVRDLKPMWDFFKDHISGNIIVVLTNFVKIIRDLMPLIKPIAIVLVGVLVVALEAVALAARGLTDALEFVVRIVSDVVKAIVAPFQWLYDKLVGHSIIPDLINGVINWFKKLPGELLSLATSAAHHVISAVEGLPGKVIGFFSDLYHGAIKKAQDLVNWVKGLPGKILGALGDLGKILWNAGLKIIEGLWNGLKSKWEDVKGWVSGIGGWISDHKGPISYDRTLLTPHGQAIMQGLIDGLKSKHDHLRRALGDITDTIRKTAVPGIAVNLNGSVTQAKPVTPPGGGGPPAAGAMLAGTRIGVYVAPGGIQVQGGSTTTEKSISDQLTRVARFGAFGTGD